MQAFLADVLQCPGCATPLEGVTCPSCGRTYERDDGIYDFVVGEPAGLDALGDAVAELADEKGLEEIQRDYEAAESAAERETRRQAGMAFAERLADLSGVVVEVASGMGGVFEPLARVEGVTPVATDLSVDTLRTLRGRIEADMLDSPHAFLACDAQELPFRDGRIDAVVSAGGLNNIEGPAAALGEAARVLRPGGVLRAVNTFVDPGTESAELAVAHDLGTGFLEERFVAAAEAAGFADLRVEPVGRVEATGNPYDLLPVAGDVQTFAVVDCRIGDG